ncbi:hypothetical protein [Vallitalea guaymasensis]|uniref:hypothetical protein n=1 Tax=Vallitalea guaymasensis TaxID=1185412 RepID=UPI00272C03EE|nr:hypothetical protein [Vallitalea guaymasensis]
MRIVLSVHIFSMGVNITSEKQDERFKLRSQKYETLVLQAKLCFISKLKVYVERLPNYYKDWNFIKEWTKTK